MASSRDVKDIMGVAAPAAVAPVAAPKKPKPAATKRLTGINREVLALHGDRAPPVSIIDSTKTFRAKLKRDFKPAAWDFSAFTNEARRDDLQLRHWKRRKPNKPPAGEPGPDAMEIENRDPDTIEPYRFAKYNIDISVPEYDDDKYNAHLQSDDWSREETDYLIALVKEYAQKWPIIIDRYEWPLGITDSTTALARPQDARTLEALKARYYHVWAKCLALEHGGESGMNETEFALYETLTKYKPEIELQRKELGWRLFERPLEEIREEEYLLAELQRIMISAQKFEAERAEVRQRLDHPVSRSGNVPASFAELNQLYNQLFAQDRNRRARGRLSINANDLAQSPAGALGVNGTPVTASGHRDSLASASAQKKGSVSTAGPIRSLDARAEKKYGITSHDRLTSGVTFRSDKLLKLRQAKSQIQTQKIAAALVELGVPDMLQLPTQRVMDAFESLVQKVQKLVETRKFLEKEEVEARVQGGLRKELQKDTDGDAEPKTEEPTQPEEEEEDEDEDEEDEAKEGDADEDKDAEGEEDDDDADADEVDEVDEAEEEENDDHDGEDGSQFDGNDAEDEEDAEGEDEDDDADADADAEGEEMEVD